MRIGIFGGTFNPPHNGHIAMISGIAALPQIEKVLVMPANIPPHKAGDIAAAHHIRESASCHIFTVLPAPRRRMVLIFITLPIIHDFSGRVKRFFHAET